MRRARARARAMPPRVAQARFETFKPGVDELEAEIAEKKRWLVQLDSPGGENYGWRVFEASIRYSQDADPGNTVFPVAEYNHNNGCSITGGYAYRGEALPDLQGVYIYGDWCSGRTWATYQDEAGTWQTLADFIPNTGLAISAFGEDESGELYVADYSGRILKLTAAQ